ncbi:TPA: hypothetical protein TUD77_001109 [Streptococcus equi subsp. zooepidemicus]|uniref:hypothetical protein n=1 Tax=Streptococcus equi TaxID=1336 RepID=UPI0005C316BE|nr:hypothetical protein [Streptococcus equi]HEL0066151.1 hypothetical protein [Streptococcus equi subsp. zooepidemicus]KIS10236.1 hypothetical protein AT51_00530 [Streptococcus equi subsp. zooepidemicus Sz57]HEL0074330.1 hypothetical protein [Streptococcus equi subsp. zooepidemicus]HEL0088621.1 hypothetical protein [Streptococcus equi subsp. zooepidemicus]HEL0223060.1 hypothetical protein [Streptococcus equi subsp. zooepidemicus]
MSKTTLLTSVSLLCLAASANTLTVKAENSADLYIEANRSVGNEVPLTPEQQAILDNMSNLEQKYLDYGLSKPVEFDSKNFFKARIGGWSWRDGLICVTDEGIGTRRINTWHAAIVAPQRPYVVAEAPGVTERVRFRSNENTSQAYCLTHWDKCYQCSTRLERRSMGWNSGRKAVPFKCFGIPNNQEASTVQLV